VLARVETAALWLVGNAPKILPFLVIAIVVALSWKDLREIHPRDVRAALHVLDSWWMAIAVFATLLNIGVMGLCDVIVFAHTRPR
jgi:hypothetical protein